MSHYALEQLIEFWKEEQMTIEQMIGHLLLVYQDLDRRVRDAARRAPPAEEHPPALAPAAPANRRRR